MNYDYTTLGVTEKSKNFPYGTESVFVIKKQDILYYKAMAYNHNTGKYCQIKIYVKGDNEIIAYFNNSDEVKEAMNVLGGLDSTVVIARAKAKDGKSFQRDFITNNHNRNLYEDAINNL